MAHVLDPAVADRGRETLARHAWTEAFELLSSADAHGPLPPEDLELLGRASWWTGALPAVIEILASASTIDSARRPFAELERRTVELKGISRPVQVVAIAW